MRKRSGMRIRKERSKNISKGSGNSSDIEGIQPSGIQPSVREGD